MSSKTPNNEPFDVQALETLSPFTFDEDTITKGERLARDASKGKYPVYTLDVTSPLFPDVAYKVEVLRNDFNAIRIARMSSKTKLINCTATLPAKEGDRVKYIFTPAAMPKK